MSDDLRPWCWRKDEEDYEPASGPFDTREEAIEDAFDDPERQTAIIGRCRWVTVLEWMPSIDELLDEMNDRVYDNGSGPPDDPVFEIKQEHLVTAQAELNAWAEKWIEAARWYNCVDEEKVTRDEFAEASVHGTESPKQKQ